MNDKEILCRVGETIRIERLKKKLSQQDLAELAGLSTKYVNMIENQKSNPTIVKVVRLCKALNISLNKLIED